jgi:hypothetical protein
MFKDILEQIKEKVNSNVIDFEYKNGWDQNTLNLFKELKKHSIEGTYSVKTLGNCLYEFTEKIKDPKTGEIYTVIHKLDSGD